MAYASLFWKAVTQRTVELLWGPWVKKVLGRSRRYHQVASQIKVAYIGGWPCSFQGKCSFGVLWYRCADQTGCISRYIHNKVSLSEVEAVDNRDRQQVVRDLRRTILETAFLVLKRGVCSKKQLTKNSFGYKWVRTSQGRVFVSQRAGVGRMLRPCFPLLKGRLVPLVVLTHIWICIAQITVSRGQLITTIPGVPHGFPSLPYRIFRKTGHPFSALTMHSKLIAPKYTL